MKLSMMLRWAGILGAVEFACGFVGPMVLAPDANQGPMLGIFITGPAGVVLGVILGLVVDAVDLAPAIASRILYAVAAVGAATTLYFCIPSPHFHAAIIDGEIRQCAPPERLRDKSVEHLNALTASHHPLPKPVVWSDAFDSALAKERGVVIEVHVVRETNLYERKARWNLGTFEVRPWVAAGATRTYFANYAGADCGSYPAGARSVLKVTGHVGIWPPSFAAEMLELQVAAPLSANESAVLANVGGAH